MSILRNNDIDSKATPCESQSAANVDLKSKETKPSDSVPSFREKKQGVWTLYYLPSSGWEPRSLFGSWENTLDITTTLGVWYRFFSEVVSLGPVIVSLYFASLAISSVLPSIKLNNDAKLLSLAEMALAGRTPHATVITEFKRIFVESIVTLAAVWAITGLKEHSRSIVEHRVSLHFEQQILAVQSQLELTASKDPSIDAGLRSVKRYSSKAWTTLDGLMNMLSPASEVVALGSILKSQLVSSETSSLFGLWATAYPLLWALRGVMRMNDQVSYAKTTDENYLRMRALYKIGTEDKYKQEILSSGLEEYINNEYARAKSKLGDVSIKHPWSMECGWFGLENFSQVFDSLPMLFYSWNAVHNPSGFSLSTMIRMQQTSSAVRMAIFTMVFRLKSISDLTSNITTLYEVLAFKPGIVDGQVSYPDEVHSGQKGMAIEFKSVSFGYLSAPNKVLKNLSFKVEPGQLCVIVTNSETRCGKSTTINLISRSYHCDSGEIYVDGRPIRDYKVSTLRAAINVMYQSYAYFPFTIKENLLMGSTSNRDSGDDAETLEKATKLGGAYDFIQKLPLGLDTPLEPIKTAMSSPGCRVSDSDKFKCLAATEKNVDFSGGQWQRLALSRSFVKNSETTRLLCYDEPSASLDPKAEVGKAWHVLEVPTTGIIKAMFERLRSLRGEKTMIFVTHRFGHLTKHADLIVYIGDGSVIEQGTHKSLLAEEGEYAKMYKIQSEAFADSLRAVLYGAIE